MLYYFCLLLGFFFVPWIVSNWPNNLHRVRFFRVTALQNFIIFSRSAVGRDRKEKRQKSDSIHWNGIWVRTVIMQDCFSSILCHSIGTVTMWMVVLTEISSLPLYFWLTEMPHYTGICPLSIKNIGLSTLFWNCLLSFKPAERMFNFLLAESSQALIFEPNWMTLKYLQIMQRK